MAEENSDARGQNVAGVLFRKTNVLRLDSESSQRVSCRERERKVIPCRGTEDGKSSETDSGESGTRNLEAKSIRSRALVCTEIGRLALTEKAEL